MKAAIVIFFVLIVIFWASQLRDLLLEARKNHQRKLSEQFIISFEDDWGLFSVIGAAITCGYAYALVNASDSLEGIVTFIVASLLIFVVLIVPYTPFGLFQILTRNFTTEGKIQSLKEHAIRNEFASKAQLIVNELGGGPHNNIIIKITEGENRSWIDIYESNNQDSRHVFQWSTTKSPPLRNCVPKRLFLSPIGEDELFNVKLYLSGSWEGDFERLGQKAHRQQKEKMEEQARRTSKARIEEEKKHFGL